MSQPITVTVTGYTLTAADLRAFDALVDRRGGPSACWPWLGSCHKKDGPCFRRRGLRIPVRRVAYILAYGAVRLGAQICHKCGNRMCMNPVHLQVGQVCVEGKLDRRSLDWSQLIPWIAEEARYCHRRLACLRRFEGDDLVQEAFLAVWLNIKSFDAARAASMRTMIRRWVKWGLLAFARKSSWLGKSHYEAVRCGQARAGRPVQVKDMEHLLQWRQDGEPQDLDGAERVLRELVPDERTRRVLFGRFVLEQSLTEIGRDVGLTASMVSRIVARCDKQG